MSDLFNAFEISPVPVPGPDAVAPEPFRGIYGMPMFLTVPSADLARSERFWTEGLGFFTLFSLPGQVIHLRRWAFQDVLLVPGTPAAAPQSSIVTFACVLSQIEQLVADCERLEPGSAAEPKQTPWNTVDVEAVTPDGTRVVMTAARPFDPDSAEARGMREMGIDTPGDE